MSRPSLDRLLIRLATCWIPGRRRRRERRKILELRQHGRAVAKIARYREALAEIRGRLARRERVKVGFVIVNSTNPFWLPLYDRFAADDRFEPYVIVSPYAYASVEYMRKLIDDLVARSGGRRLIVGYNPALPESQDVRDEFRGALMFFQDPYTWMTHPATQMASFPDSLNFYVPYSYCIVNRDNTFELDSLAFAYRVFPDTALHRRYHRRYGIAAGRNLAPFLGYLGVHGLLNRSEASYPWKEPVAGMKRVILAPHHVKGLGNFLKFADFYLTLARRYADRISFVFKPHPYLRENLLEHWPRERIDAYYAAWDGLANGRLEEGAYADLMLTSDAMVLDSGSFNAEYTLVDKPLFFVRRVPRRLFNDVGEAILRTQYGGSTEEEIAAFLETVVLKGEDRMRIARSAFARRYLRPSNPDIAGSMYRYVCREIGAVPCKEPV